MRRSFTYSDAVKLLGGDTGLVKLLDHASAATVLALGGIDLLDARIEVVRLGKQVLSSVRERVGGLHRVDRTRLLEAAHGIVVMTSFFEALDEVGLPFKLKIDKREQLVVSSAHRPGSKREVDLVHALTRSSIPQPSAEQPPDAVVEELSDFYVLMVRDTLDFLSGFQAWDDLTQDARDQFGATAAHQVPHRAVEHYKARYRQLSLDCPEFSVWTTGIEHAATRSEVRGQRTALEDMRELLKQLVGSQPPDDRRNALARSYRSVLGRPIVDGDVPSGLVLPTLEQAYVSPSFKVVEAGQGFDVSEEIWWWPRLVRSDLDDYLAGYFTSSKATSAPLVVLGQPGAGKSLLTKMLAAQLPAEDFLPIRVVLRDVPADATLQEQVEDAITRATGERLGWSDLARAAAPAVPVVLLDGFDELLQATGTSRSDYLARVREFQLRELDQGRAVIVVVTSRTAVANRARLAGETVVLKLEPFGHDHVRRWLDVWNTVNPGAVLTPEVALKFEDLAGQPLLLFMLALYNADGNALEEEDAELAKARLYEQLLTRFARREVVKSLPGALDEQVDRVVEEELIRLSVVAFAMFNRGVQWVDETELDDDLNALLPGTRGVPDRRLRLSSAQLAVGRFFFVHAARAAHDGQVLQTYEFLHATFGEYLVARMVHRVSLEALARDRATTSSLYGRQESGTGWLEPVLSFAPMTTRTPVISFLRELFDGTSEADRAALYALFTDLVGAVQHHVPGSEHPDYAPRILPIAHRIAAYTANLVTLAVVAGGRLVVYDLHLAGTTWRALTLLWQSQLDGEAWDSLTDVLAIERLRSDPASDFAVVLRKEKRLPPVDMAWLLGIDPVKSHGRQHAVPDYLDEFHRWQDFHTSWRGSYVLHNLEPFMAEMEVALRTFTVHGGRVSSLAHLLLTALTAADPSERLAAYAACLSAGRTEHESLGERYWTVLFNALARENAATVSLLEEAISDVVNEIADLDSLIGCALQLLRKSGGYHAVAVGALDYLLIERDVRAVAPQAVVETLVSFVELDLEIGRNSRVRAFQNIRGLLNGIDLDALAESDAQLIARLKRVLESIGMGGYMAR